MIAAGKLGQSLLGMDFTLSCCIFAIIFIIYTMSGGMDSVEATNKLHIGFMYFGMILAVILALKEMGGWGNFKATLDTIDAADEFRAGLAEGFRFLASHEAPYLVHCTEGKDRTGFTVAVLECLMGASAEEVEADYMVTFFNYYGIEPGTEQYDAIVRSNIAKSLATAFDVESIYDADLAAEADAYLLEIGMTREEIDALKANLGADIQ
jgi:hypothetical protein